MSDWSEIEADGDVVIPRVASTAVYCNTRGDVVIRQQGECDDAIVVIPLQFIGRVVSAIKSAARESRRIG